MPYWTDPEDALPLMIRDRLRDLLEADTDLLARWVELGETGELVIHPLPASGVAANEWRLSLHWVGTPFGSSEQGLAMWRNFFVVTVEKWVGNQVDADDLACYEAVSRLVWKLLERLSSGTYLSEWTDALPAGPVGRLSRLWDALRLDTIAPIPDVAKTRSGEQAAWRGEIQFTTESNCLRCE